MIVNRYMWVVREGHTIEEAMDLFKSFPAQIPQASRVLRPTRVYQEPVTLIFEFEFKSLGDMDSQWAKAIQDSAFGAFMEKWGAVCEWNSHKSDVWQIVQ